MFDFNSIPSQKGRIALITGANAGLGFETTKWFALKDIKVIMACRDLKKGEKAKNKILAKVPNAELEVMELDLASLESIRKFAETFKGKYDKLDLLINNAGIMIPPLMRTKDGFEIQFGVNHLGHFLLTNLLLPLVIKTENSRIVTLSSGAHRSGEIMFDDINWEKSYSKFPAYSQSKLANLMFALDLNEKLQAAGHKTLAVAAHPGVARTSLGRHVNKILYVLLLPIFYAITHTAAKGALPTVMAALDPDVKGGDYYGPQGRKEMKGPPGHAIIAPQTLDKEVRNKLWSVSEELTGEKFEVS
jgi:NAD(P)-dependent dehydrogenase (short-subunit alcohol dehydrogenase family)